MSQNSVDSYETCLVCNKKETDVIDGFCMECETLWFDEIALITKKSTVPIKLSSVFKKAVVAARIKYNSEAQSK